MKISLQATVKIKLTDKALDILRSKVEGIFVNPPTDPNGYSTWSLYRIMNKLGVKIDIEKPNELIDAMEYHWNDFVGDTHSLPNDIELSNQRRRASFSAGEWAERVAEDVANQLSETTK